MTEPSGYCPIEDYGIIGDMHTCALISKSGSIDFMCWPVFDSPSMFCRLLDKTKGGYFLITAHPEGEVTSKQRYVPYTNILETQWVHEYGAVNVIDFFPVSTGKESMPENVITGVCPCYGQHGTRFSAPRRHSAVVRKVTSVRGELDMAVELFPAFNYARDGHKVIGHLSNDFSQARTQTLLFESPTERLQVDIHADVTNSQTSRIPVVQFEVHDKDGLKGQGLFARLKLAVGQSMTFILHSDEVSVPEDRMSACIAKLESHTCHFWTSWARQCTYCGHYQEQVLRSLLLLKLLTYKPTGAIIAAATFSLPEDVGGDRNWDYRYTWVRDTAFTLYVFMKNGYTEEAEQYMSFVFNSILPSAGLLEDTEQFLPLILTIRGETGIPEMELQHLEGYRASAPVRIGNAATTHVQHDVYGALFDCIYLYNKHVGPISYDQWVAVRNIVSHITKLYKEPDMSIWEVRGERQHFVYSKIMLWVAMDRAIRLAEKRSNLPCPQLIEWRSVRDNIYEEVLTHGYNIKGNFFSMSYENSNAVDASILIASLVFFIAPDDPRFLATMDKIMQTPEKGGLTSSKMVLRYDHAMVHDGSFPLIPCPCSMKKDN